ncbi:MAG: nucleotidyltransferase family protein [Bellilinea sp.]
MVKVAAIVLAAGASRRMKQAKMTLSYKGSTVLGTVLTVLHSAGIDSLIVVIGGAKDGVEMTLSELPFEVIRAYNPEYEHTEMLDSLQIGMQHLPDETDAFLIALGDQPQIQGEVVQAILQEYTKTGNSLIIPSYRMRRGHPWMVGKVHWADLRDLHSGQTMRNFIQQYQKQIHYLVVDTQSILEDMDTPEDYQRAIGEA